MKVVFGNVKDFAGNNVLDQAGQPLSISKMLANMIAGEEAKGDNVMKKLELAQALYKLEVDEEYELADSDREIVKGIAESGKMTVLVGAQVLKAIQK